MEYKQQTAGMSACASTHDDNFALEALESRTFFSGGYAPMPHVQMMGQTFAMRQDVMVSRQPVLQTRTVAFDGGGIIAERTVTFAQNSAYQISISIERVIMPQFVFVIGDGDGRGGLPHHEVRGGDWGHHMAPPPQMSWPDAPPAIEMPAPSPGISYDSGDAAAPTGSSAPSTSNQASGAASRVLNASKQGAHAVATSSSATTVLPLPAIRFNTMELSGRAADVVREAAPLSVAPVSSRSTDASASKLQSALSSALRLGATATSQSMRWISDPSLAVSQARAMAGDVVPQMARAARPMVERLASMILPRRVFNFARLGDPLAMLNDPLAAFADESASSSMTVIATGASARPGAWTVTFAVIATDVVLLTYMYRSGRTRRGRLHQDARFVA
jgi:hypothetical protein